MIRSALILAAAAAFAHPFAATAEDHNRHPMQAAPGKADHLLAAGTIKKVDKGGASLTIAHGPIDNIGMGPMTMAFKVKEPRLAVGLKPGDKVRFFADYVGGEIVILRIETVK